VIEEQKTASGGLLDAPAWVFVLLVVLILLCVCAAAVALAGGSRGVMRRLRRDGWIAPAKPPDLALAQGTLVMDERTAAGLRGPSGGASFGASLNSSLGASWAGPRRSGPDSAGARGSAATSPPM
jgi:hypothetical protein